jgi:hypothetical protein
MVDPISRYGHAVPVNSFSKDNIINELNRLMMAVHRKPMKLYFSSFDSFFSEVSNQYPSVQFFCGEHSKEMKNEHDVFRKQLNKCINENANWLTGAAVVQAVTNTLPIPPPQDEV